MATMPPASPMQPAVAAPAAPVAPEAEAPESGGYTICVYVSDAGAITLGIKDGGEEPGEEEEPSVPVKNINQVSEMIKTILANDGHMRGEEEAVAMRAAYGKDQAAPVKMNKLDLE